MALTRLNANDSTETMVATMRRDGAMIVENFVDEAIVDQVLADLQPEYGMTCPVAVVYRASWPDQQIIRATLGTLKAAIQTKLILVGPALAGEGFDESCLYASDYDRRFRPQSAKGQTND